MLPGKSVSAIVLNPYRYNYRVYKTAEGIVQITAKVMVDRRYYLQTHYVHMVLVICNHNKNNIFDEMMAH